MQSRQSIIPSFLAKRQTRHVDVPLIFTSYNLTEAKEDYELILENSPSELMTKAGKVKNPYRSYRSIRDFEFDHDSDVFYCNQYLSVVVNAAN